MINPDLFVESFVVQLPSPSSHSHTSIDSHPTSRRNHCSINRQCHNDGNFKVYKVATAYHSIEIKLLADRYHNNTPNTTKPKSNNRPLKVKVHHLPEIKYDHECKPINLNDDNADNGERRRILKNCYYHNTELQMNNLAQITEEEQQQLHEGINCNKKCLAHSFLPMSHKDEEVKDDKMHYFLEAFLLFRMNTSSVLDDTQHSTTAYSKIGMNALSHDTSQSSLLDGDKRNNKDDSSLLYHDNTSKVNHLHPSNEFYLVLRGFLPTSSNSDILNNEQTIYNSIDDEKDNDIKHVVDSNIPEQASCKRGSKRGQKTQYNFFSSIPISSKPSTITLCNIGSNSDNIANNNVFKQALNTQIGLIIGNDTRLKLYQLSNEETRSSDDGTNKMNHQKIGNLIMTEKTLLSSLSDLSEFTNQHELIPVLLQVESVATSTKYKNALLFESKVTSIDTFQIDIGNSQLNCIVVGCASGNIRIISFIDNNSDCNTEALIDGDENNIKINTIMNPSSDRYYVQTTEFLVDGPILSVRFFVDEKMLDIIVGSACGYACLFRKPLYSDEKVNFKQIPTMIVEGLWNTKKKIDDSILSVSKIPYIGFCNANEIVAIGTLSGRVLLFTRKMTSSDDKSKFVLLWHVQLHHPVHSITYIMDEFNLPSLVIMTQKTLHLFNIDVRACIDKCKSRLYNFVKLSQT